MSTRLKAAMRLSNLTPDSKVTRAQGIIDAMQASGNFPDNEMTVSYSRLQTLIDNLHNAILATNAGTTSSTTNMHEQERILLSAFNLVKAHVEYVANNSLDAATIITSAGMQVAVTGGANAVTELTLEAIGNGTITVKVPRGKDEKAFIFELSTDGTSFTKIICSALTKVNIANLTPASTVYIRYSAISKTGEGAISQAKSVIVN